MNGGLAVDVWGRTSLEGCYAVGEAAGTHGVTRPGGAALNAGQVFGARCAEHIASRPQTRNRPMRRRGRSSKRGVGGDPRRPSRRQPDRRRAIETEVQARMSDHAGFVCNAERRQEGARRRAGAQRARSASEGVAFDGAYEAARALQWRQMAIVSEAVLTALAFYIGRGGGSRGARAVCSPEGERVPLARTGPLERFPVPARAGRRPTEQILVRLDGERFVIRTRPLRARDRERRPFFERDWPDFLTGASSTSSTSSIGANGLGPALQEA